MNQLSEIFKKGLEKTKYSQAEAARLSGIERKTFNTYVNGTREPDFETLIKVASTLKVENEICLLIMEQFVPTEKNEHMGINNIPAAGFESKYLALLEKTIVDKDKNLEQKEADLVALRSAVNGIADIKNKVDKLEPIVYGLSSKVVDAETSIEVLREWLIDQFSKLKKESPQSVAASMGRKWTEIQDKRHGTHTG